MSSPPLRRRDWLRLAVALAPASACGGTPVPPQVPPPVPPQRPSPWPPGPLSADPAGLLDLPAGFRYVVLQRGGVDRLDDGRPVPGRFDGMTCFALPDGTWALLRNHELGSPTWAFPRGLSGSPKLLSWTPADKPFDAEYHGGASRLVVDPAALAARFASPAGTQPVIKSTRMVLTGTDRNCAGGAFDLPGARGWVSSEESDEAGHGYAFFVPADATGVGSARRLDAWGRFRHEGVARGDDGTIYLTEDHADGLLYRFRPAAASAPFGAGVLEALSIDGLPHAHPDQGRGLAPGERKVARWLPVPDPSARATQCRDQLPAATRLRRCEGLAWASGAAYLAATQGGENRLGQILRLVPGAGGAADVLEVLVGGDGARLSGPDNLVLSPWGDLVVCEDNYTSNDVVRHQHVRGLRLDGTPYDLARNPKNEPDAPGGSPGDEFAGACFSPDRRYLFVNLSGSDLTFAITGPWPGLAS